MLITDPLINNDILDNERINQRFDEYRKSRPAEYGASRGSGMLIDI